jgi:hypothetical protein
MATSFSLKPKISRIFRIARRLYFTFLDRSRLALWADLVAVSPQQNGGFSGKDG